MVSKRPAAKKQEPPAEQQQPPAGEPIGYATEDIPEGGTGEMIRVPVVRPMAAPEPAIEDRVKALELANLELEKRIGKIDTFILRVARDHSYQYGGTT
jgi:hypothetical protein